MSIFQKTFSRRHVLKGLAVTALCVHAPLGAFAAERVHTQTRVALGTFVTLHAVHTSADAAEKAFAHAFDTITQLEAELTRHNSASPLSYLHTQGALNDVPQSLAYVLHRAQRAHSLTQGAFDISVAPLVDMFRTHQNPQGHMTIDAAQLAEVRELVDASKVHISDDGRRIRLEHSGMALTLDGIAKGHIVDSASAVLAQHGMTHHLVNIGGDIRAHGMKSVGQPWRVAVENPTGTQAITLPLHGAIATSGNYAMFYDAAKKHHHLIDPTRKQSPQHISSVSVLAPTALEADALATALSVLPVNTGLQLVRSLAGRECCMITAQGNVMRSDGWPST